MKHFSFLYFKHLILLYAEGIRIIFGHSSVWKFTEKSENLLVTAIVVSVCSVKSPPLHLNFTVFSYFSNNQKELLPNKYFKHRSWLDVIVETFKVDSGDSCTAYIMVLFWVTARSCVSTMQLLLCAWHVQPHEPLFMQ